MFNESNQSYIFHSDNLVTVRNPLNVSPLKLFTRAIIVFCFSIFSVGVGSTFWFSFVLFYHIKFDYRFSCIVDNCIPCQTYYYYPKTETFTRELVVLASETFRVFVGQL